MLTPSKKPIYLVSYGDKATILVATNLGTVAASSMFSIMHTRWLTVLENIRECVPMFLKSSAKFLLKLFVTSPFRRSY